MISTEEHRPLRETPSEPGWPGKPRPLPAELPDVPALPEALLPEAVRGWILDAVDRLQVPSEMVAAPALVSAGALIGRSAGVRPKERDDWVALPNLWGLVVGRPATLKSPALREATRHGRTGSCRMPRSLQGGYH